MWVGELPDGRDRVTAVAFAPDGQTLYTGDSDGYVLAWDLATRTARELYRRPPPGSVTGDRVVSGLWPTADGRLLVRDWRRLVDVLPAEPRAAAEGETDPYRWRDYEWSVPPAGRRAVSWGHGLVRLWDLDAGRQLPVPGPLGEAQYLAPLALLPDGVTLLTHQFDYGSTGHGVRVWDVHSGQPVGRLAPGPTGIGSHRVGPAAVSADGAALAVGWLAALWVYDVPARRHRFHPIADDVFRVLAFDPSGRWVLAGFAGGAVAVWDVVEGREVRQYDWGVGEPSAVAVAPDGLTAAVGAAGRFVVFDLDL